MTVASDRNRHIVLDTDCGIDDALALLYLAGRPDADLAAVTTVYGNAPLEAVVRNVGYVLELAGLPGVPVAVGAPGPIAGTARIASHVHGADGLGDVIADKEPPRNLVDHGAARFLVDLARERPGYYDLLAVGPLTNVGQALEIEPELLTSFRSVVMMGGSGPFPPLGAVQLVDANVQNDPEAARRVVHAPRNRLVSVGVNVTTTTIVDEAALARLHGSGTRWGEFAGAVLESYADFYQYAWGRRVSPAHDGLAAALLVEPAWIAASRTGPMNVTSDGFSVRAHLMRTADGGPVAWSAGQAPDSVVVTDVNREGFLADFLGILATGGGSTW
ncbi:nucleoside hydrolase [Jiangella asiatica]|uniref:Nucleoside hydrolase n=1 Tax=Jiangella asiatica TaxID=2530372 RepID=A0A4R5DN42_9ACTN|nr:nucleoside hydrolase [Jiangella asiatica]TDE15736.1 nucleoside hydrolase [Jiangella asiatica]